MATLLNTVDPDAYDERPLPPCDGVRLDEYPAELAVGDDQVVGPPDSRGHVRGLADGLASSDRGQEDNAAAGARIIALHEQCATKNACASRRQP